MNKHRNLDQIRAANAINVKIARKPGDSKAIAKKVPTMIMENGLIATAAFALESNVDGYECVFVNGIIPHLKSLRMLPGQRLEDLRGFTSDLCDVESAELRVITSESLAYLNYLRRFAAKNTQPDNEE